MAITKELSQKDINKQTIEEWRKEQAKKVEREAKEREKYMAHKREELEYRRDRDSEKVKGIFRYHEVPGGVLKFSFRKYPTDPIDTHVFIDGQTYEIPLAVATHLNDNGWYPKYKYHTNEQGQMLAGYGYGDHQKNMEVIDKTHRFSFQSLDFSTEAYRQSLFEGA